MKIKYQDEGQIIIKESFWFALILMVAAELFFYIVFSILGMEELKEKNPIMARYLPVILIAVPIILSFLFTDVEIVLDKSVNQVKIIKKKLWGSKKTKELQFDEVEKIVMREEISTNTSYNNKTGQTSSQSTQYPLYFYLKSGEIGSEVLIGGKASGLGILKKHRQIGQTISEFMGISFDEVRATAILK